MLPEMDAKYSTTTKDLHPNLFNRSQNKTKRLKRRRTGENDIFLPVLMNDKQENKPSLEKLSETTNRDEGEQKEKFHKENKTNTIEDLPLLEAMKDEISKRVVAGIIMNSTFASKQSITSKKTLTKRLDKFLGRSPQAPVFSPQPPQKLSTQPTLRQQQSSGNTWYLKEEKLCRVFNVSLKSLYEKSSDSPLKSRYIRVPLTPIPSIEWIFRDNENTE